MNSKSRFSDTFECDEGLKKAADVAVREVLAVKENETVLIITNPDKDVLLISQSVYDAVTDVGGKPTLFVQPVKAQLDFAEASVIGALKKNPDIAISISKEKLGKDREALAEPYVVGEKKYDHIFTYLLNEKKMRSFWSPSVTTEMFAETVPIDYDELRDSCAKLKKHLTDAESVRITSEKETDIVIGLNGREAHLDDGDFREPGKGGNLPCGEVYISPQLGASNGTIVFDGSIAATEGEIIIENPITVNVVDGFVVSVEGAEEADKLREALRKGEETAHQFAKDGKIPESEVEEYAKNARNLGELGVGLNKNAKIVGNMLEDEKVYRTCHIALGSNYDEDAKALIHLDGLIKNPTLVVKYPDGTERKIIENGELF